MISNLKNNKHLLLPLIVGIILGSFSSLIESKSGVLSLNFTYFIAISLLLNLSSGVICLVAIKNKDTPSKVILAIAYCPILIIIFCLFRWSLFGHIVDNWIGTSTCLILLLSILPVFLPFVFIQLCKIGLKIPQKLYQTHELNQLVNLSTKSGLDKGAKLICIYEDFDNNQLLNGKARVYHFFSEEPTFNSLKRFLLNLNQNKLLAPQDAVVEGTNWSIFSRRRFPWSSKLEDIYIRLLSENTNKKFIQSALRLIIKHLNNPMERILFPCYQIDPYKTNLVNKIRNRDHIYLLKHLKNGS